MSIDRWIPLLIVPAVVVSVRDAAAQPQVTVATPMVSVRDSFFEQSGVRWQVNGPGFFARFGGGVQPPFGNFTPGAGVSGGLGFGGGGFSGNLGFDFSQGASRSIVSTTPMVTGIAGQPMFIQSGVVRPFVTGLVPVVGPAGGFGSVADYGPAYNSLPMMVPYRPPGPRTVAGLRAQELGLGRGNQEDRAGEFAADVAPAANVAPRPAAPRALIDPVPPTRAERARQQAAAAAERDAKALDYFERGRMAEDAGKTGVARIYYQMAARQADGELRREITERLASLK